jgi:hypothetical protein
MNRTIQMAGGLLFIAGLGLVNPLTFDQADATQGHEPVTLCHNHQTITVDDDSVLQAHLAHGDTIGTCPLPPGTSVPPTIPEPPTLPTTTVVILPTIPTIPPPEPVGAPPTTSCPDSIPPSGPYPQGTPCPTPYRPSPTTTSPQPSTTVPVAVDTSPPAQPPSSDTVPVIADVEATQSSSSNQTLPATGLDWRVPVGIGLFLLFVGVSAVLVVRDSRKNGGVNL